VARDSWLASARAHSHRRGAVGGVEGNWACRLLERGALVRAEE
jgi:hypothetical protein